MGDLKHGTVSELMFIHKHAGLSRCMETDNGAMKLGKRISIANAFMLLQ